jgi:hypothetical protein
MSNQLRVIENPQELTAHMERFREVGSADIGVQDAIVFTRLGGGILNFAAAAFPGLSPEEIYADVNEREPEGRGAHFDVYANTLDGRYPWLGIYNLSGSVAVKASPLPVDLARIYFERFPEPTDNTYQARRDFSSIALLSEDVTTFKGRLDENMGMIVLQKASGPHVIHDVLPQDPRNPGEFVKMTAPDNSDLGRWMIDHTHSIPLDELLTTSLTGRKESSEESVPELPSGSRPTRVPSLPRHSRPRRTKSRCNLD